MEKKLSKSYILKFWTILILLIIAIAGLDKISTCNDNKINSLDLNNYISPDDFYCTKSIFDDTIYSKKVNFTIENMPFTFSKNDSAFIFIEDLLLYKSNFSERGSFYIPNKFTNHFVIPRFFIKKQKISYEFTFKDDNGFIYDSMHNTLIISWHIIQPNDELRLNIFSKKTK